MTLLPPDVGHPAVSVVMVTHNAWSLTERALAALIDHTKHPFELIIVDNASSDRTRSCLTQLREAHVIFNETNVGFGRANNQAVEHARASSVLLINSDVFVQPGWLEPLLAAAQEDVGAVVPRLLNPDGSLQDAGIMLAQDGTVVVYGDGDEPRRLQYRFRRILDAASAACMLIKRDVFVGIGGFDESYSPAYYEDTDLCLRLQDQGVAIVYEPRSTVVHERYGSGDGAAAERLSARNRTRFTSRWRPRLLGHPRTLRNATEQMIIAARDASATPRMLVCADLDDLDARRIAEVLVHRWPRARVTWTCGGVTQGVEFLLEQGIEPIDEDEPDWLHQRLFHYDLVAIAEGVSAQLVATIDRTQPQAVRIRLSDPDGEWGLPSPALLTAAGIAPGPEPDLGLSTRREDRPRSR